VETAEERELLDDTAEPSFNDDADTAGLVATVFSALASWGTDKP
jgi:hypothetical protein